LVRIFPCACVPMLQWVAGKEVAICATPLGAAGRNSEQGGHVAMLGNYSKIRPMHRTPENHCGLEKQTCLQGQKWQQQAGCKGGHHLSGRRGKGMAALHIRPVSGVRLARAMHASGMIRESRGVVSPGSIGANGPRGKRALLLARAAKAVAQPALREIVGGLKSRILAKLRRRRM
jgi:hypothetical protein